MRHIGWCVFLYGWGLGLSPALAGEEAPQHLLLQVMKQADQFTVVKTTVVQVALPKQRDLKRHFPWRLQVRDASDLVLHQAGMADPTQLRGEFDRDGKGTIDGHHLKKADPVHFMVRLPLVDGKRVVFQALRPEFARSASTAAAPDTAFFDLGGMDFPSSTR